MKKKNLWRFYSKLNYCLMFHKSYMTIILKFYLIDFIVRIPEYRLILENVEQ